MGHTQLKPHTTMAWTTRLGGAVEALGQGGIRLHPNDSSGTSAADQLVLRRGRLLVGSNTRYRQGTSRPARPAGANAVTTATARLTR